MLRIHAPAFVMEGALFEWKIRMLAGNTPAIRRASKKVGGPFSAVVEQIKDAYETELIPEEARHLDLCVTLRNKVFHGDFEAATRAMQEHGVRMHPGATDRLDVPLTTPPNRTELEQFVRGVHPDAVAVDSTRSKHADHIYGWAAEFITRRGFSRGTMVLRSGTQIIDWLQNRAQERHAYLP